MRSSRSPDTLPSVLINALRSFWAEPREPDPPRRVWRDWLLVGALIAAAGLEGLTRPDLVWRPFAIVGQIGLITLLLWRRTHPLLSVGIAFGGVGILEVATIIAGRESAGLYTLVGLMVLPYALFRWGSGRDAIIGLLIMAAPHVLNLMSEPTEATDTALGFAFLLLPSALGASVRYRARAKSRQIEDAKHLEREQLARELHDTVAHHVSAIAIQAQAGLAVAGTDPDAAGRALTTIETEASHTLAEMRSIVGVLRAGEAALGPQKQFADLPRLAADASHQPPVVLEMSGALEEVRPSIQAAIFRITQEAITNARRHARRATAISVRVEGDGPDVTLTVSDDGDASSFDPESSWGYGLVGMSERAFLHHGSFEAGPNRGRGWTVKAVLPKQGRS
jgi:signal transduction histidine kinase